MESARVFCSRRSVRDFNDCVVEPGTIQRAIEAAVLAPSANNRQPWEFWVFFGRQDIRNLSSRVEEWLRNNLTKEQAAGSLATQLADPGFSVLHNAPALVLFVAKTTSLQDDEDCCLASMVFMLAARDAGLGSCWIGLARPWFNLASTKAELGIPENYSVVAPIILGYPKAWPVSHGRNTPEIHWITCLNCRHSGEDEQASEHGVRLEEPVT